MRLYILPALFLSACANVVPSTALRLNALSPMDADPASFAVALTLPDGLGIEPNSARLRLNAIRVDTGETRDAAFVLERLMSPRVIYRVAPHDLEALRAFQNSVRQWKADNGDATSGSISVTLAPCSLGEGPAEDARASVLIRIDPDGPFLPLIRNGPISEIVQPQQTLEMGKCNLEQRR